MPRTKKNQIIIKRCKLCNGNLYISKIMKKDIFPICLLSNYCRLRVYPHPIWHYYFSLQGGIKKTFNFTSMFNLSMITKTKTPNFRFLTVTESTFLASKFFLTASTTSSWEIFLEGCPFPGKSTASDAQTSRREQPPMPTGRYHKSPSLLHLPPFVNECHFDDKANSFLKLFLKL